MKTGRPIPPLNLSSAECQTLEQLVRRHKTAQQLALRTLKTPPPNATHWSSRRMAAATGPSQRSIVRIWQAFGLQPHRHEVFKLSADPLFIEKLRDIVGLYLNPPERFFAQITNTRIRGGVFRSVRQMEQAIRDYLDDHNQNPRSFVWTATADQIRQRIQRLGERICSSGH